jgi:guanosine-3',5'-bis(diphosphate) 3'-pyrophosphohydrolase
VRLNDIVQKVKVYQPGADTALIEKAYVFAAKCHDGQTRKSGDPYFVHPVSVAGIITEMKLDVSSICAALLHDVVEDCGITDAQIKFEFGEEIAFLVDGVTKLGNINFASKEDLQAESFRKMVVAMARDIRVLVVKLADRLDNMRTLEHMKPDSQERIARETLEIYAALAARLGIQWLRIELEDLAFRYLHPVDYARLNEQVSVVGKDHDKLITEVVTRLRKMLLTRGFAVDVTGRRKNLYSIWRKMKRQDCEFEQVQDFIAFRVLVENVSDCYAALGVVHSEWTPVPGRFKDYVALPKPNMYQSLHTTVMGPGNHRVEVQIRTHEMHRTAELGIAAHWQYKSNTGGLDARDAARFAWLRQLMEFQKDVADPAEFYDSVRGDLFPEDVYVFTPQGDVKTFPRGATALDFAYGVHTDLGHHCHSVRVNGAIAPFRHKLRNGDVVSIETRKDQHPSKDWLDHVVTSKARARIRQYLRERERERSIRLGRELLEREVHKRDLSFQKFLKGPQLKKTLDHFKMQSVDELFASVGYGRVSVANAVEIIAPEESSEERKSLEPGLLEKTMRRIQPKANDEGILIEGMDGILVRFAKCCNPVAGDNVTGWITRGRGVTVHRRECPKAMELDAARKVNVAWSSNARMDLPVDIRVTTNDRQGILALVSGVFTDHKLSIREANCRSETDRAVNVFHVHVTDVKQLRTVMRDIEKLTGVMAVERI